MSRQTLLSLIGGIGLTRLAVYDQRPGPDGLHGGCPHVHALCDEAYYVLAGRGRGELHDSERGMRTVELGAGDYLDFPPNVLHRIVNLGGLEILGIMSNFGLAERGEARIYFGPGVDADPQEYERLVALPRDNGLDGALERRDAAVAAYMRLLALERQDQAAYRAELRRFIGLHARESLSRRDLYAAAIAEGPLLWGGRAHERLVRLPSSPVERDPRLDRPAPQTIPGMCGLLRPVAPADLGA